MGVADPALGATNVGEYVRWGQYQELQFMMQSQASLAVQDVCALTKCQTLAI